MLIIYTEIDGDPVTRVLSGYARSFAAESAGASPTCLLPQQFHEHQMVRAVLRANGANRVLFFGHGRSRPPGLLAQDGMPWLDRVSCKHLAGRSLVAAACYSRDGIARQALASGAAVVVGYRGPLFVPLAGPGVQEMVECILTVPRALRDGHDLRDACEEARRRYLETAQRLRSMESLEAKLAAPYVRRNAKAIGIASEGFLHTLRRWVASLCWPLDRVVSPDRPTPPTPPTADPRAC